MKRFERIAWQIVIITTILLAIWYWGWRVGKHQGYTQGYNDAYKPRLPMIIVDTIIQPPRVRIDTIPYPVVLYDTLIDTIHETLRIRLPMYLWKYRDHNIEATAESPLIRNFKYRLLIKIPQNHIGIGIGTNASIWGYFSHPPIAVGAWIAPFSHKYYLGVGWSIKF